MVVASGGNANLKSGAAPVAQDIAGTNWRLGLWPAAASGSSSIARLMLPGIAALLALVLLGLSVALPMLWLGDALRQDNKSFSTLFSDIRNGALMGQYPFRLKEFGHLAQALRSSGAEIIHDRHDLEKKAQLDNLTGLASRAAFDTKLKQLHQQARGGLASTLLIADIDNFKGVKAQLGPKACDALLKLFARQLREALRQSDVAARIENGKFAILFPFTGLDKIEPIADRLRARLAEEFDPGSNAPQAFSWSAGLTLVAQTDADTAASFTRAEAALKQAFTEGGNRTVTQAPPT
jgi:diguanylate cyclase (GGDEF)-like protein